MLPLLSKQQLHGSESVSLQKVLKVKFLHISQPRTFPLEEKSVDIF